MREYYTPANHTATSEPTDPLPPDVLLRDENVDVLFLLGFRRSWDGLDVRAAREASAIRTLATIRPTPKGGWRR